MKLRLLRDTFGEAYTLGKLYVDGVYFGYTCEDKDRRLEDGGVKIKNATAIPRGRYRVRLSFSNRFQKLMPEVLDVPQFSGIRIHGGNTHHDTEGCPLLGLVRTADGVANCAGRNKTLIERLEDEEEARRESWITVE
jgi:hypothetical protein